MDAKNFYVKKARVIAYVESSGLDLTALYCIGSDYLVLAMGQRVVFQGCFSSCRIGKGNMY